MLRLDDFEKYGNVGSPFFNLTRSLGRRVNNVIKNRSQPKQDGPRQRGVPRVEKGSLLYKNPRRSPSSRRVTEIRAKIGNWTMFVNPRFIYQNPVLSDAQSINMVRAQISRRTTLPCYGKTPYQLVRVAEFPSMNFFKREIVIFFLEIFWKFR